MMHWKDNNTCHEERAHAHAHMHTHTCTHTHAHTQQGLLHALIWSQLCSVPWPLPAAGRGPSLTGSRYLWRSRCPPACCPSSPSLWPGCRRIRGAVLPQTRPPPCVWDSSPPGRWWSPARISTPDKESGGIPIHVLSLKQHFGKYSKTLYLRTTNTQEYKQISNEKNG